MNPKFANTAAWQQAELLMQPVFIRVIDNIRKQLEQSSWVGTYRDIPVWQDGVSEETKDAVNFLRQQLNATPPEEREAIERRLSELPQPFPGYELCLKQHDRQVVVDLWQLCYQICFRNYNPVINATGEMVAEIDTSLIDDAGDVDWAALDAKAQEIIGQIFTSLPSH